MRVQLPVRRTPPAARPPRQGVPPVPRAQRPRAEAAKPKTNWVLIFGVLVAVVAFMTLSIGGIGALFIFGGGRALPNVYVANIHVGGRTAQEIAGSLPETFTIRLRDGERVFPIDSAQLGVVLDRAATAQAAADYGRSGDFNTLIRAVISRADMPPVISVDGAAAAQLLQQLAPQLEIAPVNAGVRMINGEVVAREAQNGRALDLDATLAQITAESLADGELELVMYDVAPQVSDASGLLTIARALLISPLQINAYDPFTNVTTPISIPPETWSEWITTGPNTDAAMTLALTLDAPSMRAHLETQTGLLGEYKTLNFDEAVSAAQTALAAGSTSSMTRVYELDRPYVVQPGDSIISIAYDYGIPYPYIEQANPGVGALSVGQTITLPSRDVNLPLDIIPNKRIVVSMSEQRVRVYENNALIWDWVGSTGISSSPTWPGVYQVLSHEPNAYAGNWDLWMPNFMGIYRPIPGSDFTNGFHGFPTRGGSQLLWTNSLGTRVTYGCVLLSDTNVQLLYNWAEDGVVVEILG